MPSAPGGSGALGFDNRKGGSPRRNINNAPNTVTSALAELGAGLGISEADFGGKLKIEDKDPVVASRHHIGESTAVLPPQVELSEFKLGSRFRGDPNGASKLDWSVFTGAVSEKQGKKLALRL